MTAEKRRFGGDKAVLPKRDVPILAKLILPFLLCRFVLFAECPGKIVFTEHLWMHKPNIYLLEAEE
jgi:hypothetical protein